MRMSPIGPKPQALPSPSGAVVYLDAETLAKGIEASKQSRRRRFMIPLQRSEAALVQRLVNILQPGSYVRPHKHPRPQAAELICVLQGAVRLFIFDDQGFLIETRRLLPGTTRAIADMEPGVWHSFAALEPDTVVLEIKGGPYDAALDKIWPDWAPQDPSPEAADYLAALLATPETTD